LALFLQKKLRRSVEIYQKSHHDGAVQEKEHRKTEIETELNHTVLYNRFPSLPFFSFRFFSQDTPSKKTHIMEIAFSTKGIEMLRSVVWNNIQIVKKQDPFSYADFWEYHLSKPKPKKRKGRKRTAKK